MLSLFHSIMLPHAIVCYPISSIPARFLRPRQLQRQTGSQPLVLRRQRFIPACARRAGVRAPNGRNDGLTVWGQSARRLCSSTTAARSTCTEPAREATVVGPPEPQPDQPRAGLLPQQHLLRLQGHLRDRRWRPAQKEWLFGDADWEAWQMSSMTTCAQRRRAVREEPVGQRYPRPRRRVLQIHG